MLEEAVGCIGTGVTSGCEPIDKSAEKQLGSFTRTVCPLNHWNLSPESGSFVSLYSES